MTITTAMSSSFKSELLAGAHCFVGPQAAGIITGTTSNAVFTITSMNTVVGLAVGMSVTGTGIPAGTLIASIDSATQLTMSKAATASNAGTLAFAGDRIMMALIKVASGGTWNATATNYGSGSGAPTTSNLGTDEMTNTSGAAYTAGGLLLANVTPVLSGTTALTTFSPNPAWTSATFSATGCLLYNTGPVAASAVARLGGTYFAGATAGQAQNRVISTHDFGGTQTVSAGTFTVLMPTADASNALLRIA